MHTPEIIPVPVALVLVWFILFVLPEGQVFTTLSAALVVLIVIGPNLDEEVAAVVTDAVQQIK